MMVVHQPEQTRFIIEQDGHTCLLEYALEGQNINFTHMYVPFRLRGKGLAEQLVEVGLAWANAEQLNVKASCWYVAKFLPQ
ncbi:GNAT family N-acetyltransferase [Thalassolituus oleivorans]|jgi:predicted GNAT family acetyltransferase|nr:GNAT family N-acetyltransferase [Thalassolituus oleivorans]